MGTDTCKTCGAKCCRYFCFQIDEPDDYAEFEDIRWYLAHEHVSVHIDEGVWYISILNPCKFLGVHNECQMYDERPLICRKYDMANCDLTGGDYGYDAEFLTPEDIEAYAVKTLGKKAFTKARAKARAKLARKGEGKGKRRDKADKAEKPRKKKDK